MKKTCLALLLAAVASGSLYAETVRVAVAANFTAPIKELAPIYEKATGDKLVLSFGATGAFYAQIKNGAPFDVLLAADSKTPAKAVKEGFGVEGTNYTYAIGKLVLWSSDAGFIKDQNSLKSDKLQKLAVANPKLAPYGEAAHQAMEALGMKAALTPKIVEGDGFVAMSQCAKDGKFTSGSGWVVPQELYKPITQDAVLLKAGEKNEGAKRFLEYLKTNKEADRIRFVYGYDTAK